MSKLKSRLILTVTLLTGVLFLFYAAGRGQTPAGGYSSPQLGGGGSLPAGLTFVAPTLTVSTAGSGNGVLALSGNTSGTATITAPAVAGTNTNPIVISNSMQIPAGGNLIPAYGFTGCTGCGSWYTGNSLVIEGGSSTIVETYGGGAPYGLWTFLSNANSELQPVGNVIQTIGDSSHVVLSLVTSGIQVSGTTFTASGCTNSTLVGGATAGTYHSGTTGTCTVTITMGNSSTATNGWSCWASDRTTPADIQTNSASTTTTATITGTTVTGDVISFGCLAF